MDIAQHIKVFTSDGQMLDVILLEDKALGSYRVLASCFAFPVAMRFKSASYAFKATAAAFLSLLPAGVQITELQTFPVVEFIDQATADALLAEAVAEHTAAEGQSWLGNLVDQAIEGSKRMENDPEHRRDIQGRTR